MPRENLPDRHEKPFLEHLEDLRRSLVLIVGCLIVGMLIALPLAPTIMELLKRPLAAGGYDPETLLRVFRVAGGFSVAMRVIFWGGLVIALPGMLAAALHFIFPGLTVRERRIGLGALGLATLLFASGVALAYFVILPLAFGVMERANHWMGLAWDFLELGDYISFVLKLLIAFGMAFELPVVVLALGYLGIATSAWLRDKRRHAIVLLLIVGMVLTPPDPLTMLMMSVPMILLYEACIWCVWLLERRRARTSS